MSFGIFEAHQNIAEEIRSAERTKANVRSHDAKKKEEYVDDQSRCFLGVVERFDATFLAKNSCSSAVCDLDSFVISPA